MFDRIAFVNIGWSDTYTGERVKGRHGFLQGKQGHECYNFKPIQGRYYGYIPPVGGHDPKPDNSMGWLVIFVAPYRGSGRLTAVGWYENATFNRSSKARPESDSESPDEDGNRFTYLISTNTAYLIDLNQRQEGGIPSDHFRQSSIVYARGQGSDAWREDLAECAEQIVAGSGEHDGKAKRLGLGGAGEQRASSSQGICEIAPRGIWRAVRLHKRDREEIAKQRRNRRLVHGT